MKIRARLLIFFIQLLILIGATYLATQKLVSGDNWFVAGLFAVIINPQLLEPFYPRPADVLGNSLFSLFLCIVAQKGIMKVGWTIFSIVLIIFIILSLITIVFGSRNNQTRLHSLAKATKTISKEATALRIYSIVFLLSLVDKYPSFTTPFWIICSAWLLIVFITVVDWERAWNSFNGFIGDGSVEGMIGPSTLLVSAPEIPSPGKTVVLESENVTTTGIITSRIRRSSDVWGQIRLSTQSDCEKLIISKHINIRDSKKEDLILGSVEENSSDNQILFYPTKPLEIGNVVSVIDGVHEIMYQINSVKISQIDIKGGAHYRTIAKATQIGVFNNVSYQVQSFRWVPNSGSTIVANNPAPNIDDKNIKPEWFKIGHILGTGVPIFMDTRISSEGHLLILGMTKMGKTTLADRLAKFFGALCSVTIFDQTSEYSKRRGYDLCTREHLFAKNGIAVLEPDNPVSLPTFARTQFEKFVNQARDEYQAGQIQQRVIIFDEAHQFIPEPSGLNYNTPARDNAIAIANQMMQIRKYGLSIIIISQRTAVVAKSAISQCENIIAFKYVDQTGLEYLESIIGSQSREIVPKLKQGEALVYGPAFSSENPVAIKVATT
ncbi:MAG TPA: hypothetical protein DCP32_09950 [Anaerolineaceae bacterium]|nr:hypothetical protein [Anaerolineaceae bacterium]